MASLNKAMIIGRCGNDPDVRQLQNGGCICNLSIATDESFTSRDGVKSQATEWHKVTLFGKQAEFAGQYLHKGSQVYVEGSLSTRKYTDKQGVERSVTEIKAQRVQFLDKPQQQQARQQPMVDDPMDSTPF